jgi:hypothetical protein
MGCSVGHEKKELAVYMGEKYDLMDEMKVTRMGGTRN